MNLRDWLIEKLNPVQPIIADGEGTSVVGDGKSVFYSTAYRDIDIVRRGVDMIVNAAASFDITVTEQLKGMTPVIGGTRMKTLDLLLNYAPNPFQDVNSFRRLLYLDLVLEGNAFIYADNNEQYHLPAVNVEVLPDKTTYVKGFKYGGSVDILPPTKVIQIKDNSSITVYRGTTRLSSAESTIKTLTKMINFQQNFFDNGAVPGLVLTSENVLGENAKTRMLNTWQARYNPKSGGRKPMILDGGLKVDKISSASFTELDFENSILNKEKAILKALGVPPLLLDGGNNANIAPNLKLFYLETVLPLVRSVTSCLERFYGYDLEAETEKVSALQPQMSEAGNFFTTLVNGGLITPNEARVELRWDKIENDPKMDEIREPKNIAGSAVDPSQGGRPPAPKG
jgi:HK97 family phage portal protein